MSGIGCMVIVFAVNIMLHVVSGELICLSCRGAPTPSDCGVVEKCGNYSHCYLDMVVEDAGAIYFNSGCRDIQKCTGSGRRRKVGMNVTSLPVPSVHTNLPAVQTLSDSSFSHKSKSRTYSDKTVNHKRSIACTTCCNYRNFCNDNGCGQKGFTTMRGPICYACDQQTTIDDCREIKVCGRDEICYIEEITLASDTIFHTSCMSKMKCIDQNIIITKSPTVSFVGRSAEYNVIHDSYLNLYHEKVDHLGDLDHSSFSYYDFREKRSTSGRGCCSGDLCNTVLPRNGNWGPWTAWGACSSSCGFTGSRQRFRDCDYPSASHGGLPCVGSATETDITCANKSCDKQLICLSCSASVHPRTCNYVEKCGPNSVCFVEEYVTHAGEIRFKTGCRDKLRCANGVRKSKRFMVNGDYLSCSECCHGTLCNSRGCGEPGYPSSRGPICYNCDQQKDPDHCGKIDVCKDGQKCGLFRHQYIDTVYQTKCLDNKSCRSDDITNSDYPKCCSTSLCVFKLGTTPKPNDGSGTVPTTSSTNLHGFTTAPTTISTKSQGFTTAPTTSSTKSHGFTTAPTTSSTKSHGFTTAPTTSSTKSLGFTTAPTTSSTKSHGFTTAPTTKSTATTAPQIVGQWTQWTSWSACLETDPNVQGTKERMRECVDPAHKHPDVCTHSYKQTDVTYCFGGRPDACTPPQITDIRIVLGTFELGHYVIVQCFAIGNPTPGIRWLRHTDDVTYYPDDSSKIVIGPIEKRHEGNYVCEAFNKCDQSTSKSFSTPALP